MGWQQAKPAGWVGRGRALLSAIMRLHLPFLDAEAPLGSRILGSPDEPPRIQRIRTTILLSTLLIGTNAIGAALVIVLILFVIPGPSVLTREMAMVNFIALPIYILLAFVVGIAWTATVGVRALGWRMEARNPTKREQIAVLALPWRFAVIEASLWLGATVFYTVAVAVVDSDLVLKVVFTIGAAGVSVAAFSYVLSEFTLRPAAAVALESGDPRRFRLARVSSRTLIAWLLGSGVPVTGMVLAAAYTYIEPSAAAGLQRATIILGALALTTGLLLTLFGTRNTVDPIRSVREGMRKIESGDLDAHVFPYDGTELGELQAGFNRMADGLRDRERIRDLFGRHVGQKVAEAALQRHPELGGEERTVALLFIDLIGSTQLAARRPPKEVVALLNRFFDVVVAEVDRRNGFVNKFEGDAALAIFGAPADLDKPAGAAMSAGRAIHRRLRSEVAECDAAIGIAYGVAVAGNIGARERFEYTVIGDPVNEAARLCELAKSVPSRLVASEAALNAAGDEARFWTTGDTVTLRGRDAPTTLAVPSD